MAARIRDRFNVEVETTPGQKAGEFAVSVDGRTVIRKRLPFIRPGDGKVLAAVEKALS